MKFASVVILVVALLLGGMIAFSQNSASASSSAFAESVSGGQQEAVALANPCTNDLNLSYADGTLTLGIELGATQPAVWNGWLIYPVVRPLWSTQISPIDPPVFFDVPVSFPSIGTVLIISWVTTVDLVTCFVSDVVDTGAPSSADASTADVPELQESIRQASEMFP
ncbi:MAG: hypothetical protein IIC22_09685 [Chloroflexi bacterium]|nr:hypothetical protein [Chloroflexota bacterium]